MGLCEARYPRLLSGAMYTAGREVLQRFRNQGYQGVREVYAMFAEGLESRAPDLTKSSRIRAMEEKYVPREMLRIYGAEEK